MNESFRTLIYVGVAAVVGLVAWANRPSQDVKTSIDREIGQPLFKDFTDPTAARSLEIVQFDETTAELRTFKVAQQNKLWVIPSHGNYPADAEKQLQDAAGSLVGLEVVGVASELAKDHADCGVIEPDKTKLKVGDKNVGTLIALQDAKGNDLVRLIVGTEVPRFPGLRFVRKPAEEIVYVTKLSLDKLPTDFDKWIEKDLLKVNTFDVSRVTLKDYSVLPSQAGGFAYSGRMEAAAESKDGNWELVQFKLYSPASGNWIDAPLGEQEELNKQKLDELKTALDDLKIVDVVRKPDGLVASLKAGTDIMQNPELLKPLVAFGFLPAELPGSGKVEIFATNGEVVVDMKDGVQYTLRFGNVEGAQKSATKPKPGEKEEVKLNRFLFVTAQLSPHTLQQPMLEPEPAGPAEPAAGTGAEKKDEAAKADGAKADDKKADDKKADDKKAEPPKPADPAAAERDRIKRENERKLNDYRDKKKKAEARVQELNSRFADWYYVISEDVYKKIHLGRAEIVKEGATARESGFNVDAFRKLESDGIKPVAPAPAVGSPAAPGFPGFPPGGP